MIRSELDTDGKALANYLKVTKQEDNPKAFAGYIALIGMGIPTALANILLCSLFGYQTVIVSKRTHERVRLLAGDNYEIIYHMIKAKQWRWLTKLHYHTAMLMIWALVGCVAAGAIVEGVWRAIRG